MRARAVVTQYALRITLSLTKEFAHHPKYIIDGGPIPVEIQQPVQGAHQIGIVLLSRLLLAAQERSQTTGVKPLLLLLLAQTKSTSASASAQPRLSCPARVFTHCPQFQVVTLS